MSKLKLHKGFTLIELLIVLGILAILITVVVTTLNPLEFLKKSRDSRRLADLTSLNKALYLAEFDNVSMGTASTTYVSIPDSSAVCANLGLPALPAGWVYACSTSANYRKTDGTGWVPVNFTSLTTVPSALTNLPIDPTNTTSTGLYYTYVKGSWELTALFESTSYQTTYAAKDNGTSTTVYEIGSVLNITPEAIVTRSDSGGGGGEGTTQYTLTVSKTGDGSGTVTSTPTGIDCGSTCNYDFDDDTEVTLTAGATEGSEFTAWSGEGCSGTGTCVVTLSEARSVTANFDVEAIAFCTLNEHKNTTETVEGVIVYCDNSLRMWTPTTNIGGSPTTYTWGGNGINEPTNSCIGIANRPACNYCDNLTYAGYSDWELPSCVSGSQDSNCILYQFGIDACGSYPCTPAWDANALANRYWSSTEFEFSANYAWQVLFNDGSVGNLSKSGGFFARCVRGQ